MIGFLVLLIFGAMFLVAKIAQMPLIVFIGLEILVVVYLAASIKFIPSERLGAKFRYLGFRSESIVALGKFQAGYQPQIYLQGQLVIVWLFFERLEISELVHVPAGTKGLIISQFGKPLSEGQKTVAFVEEIGNQLFQVLLDPRKYTGQRGLLRPVLSPGSVLAVHPAFLVVTSEKVFGNPAGRLSEDQLTPAEVLAPYSLTPDDLKIQTISENHIGEVTILDGPMPPQGVIATIPEKLEYKKPDGSPEDPKIEHFLSPDDTHGPQAHLWYQDLDAFFRKLGGLAGPQIQPVPPGTYNVNPAVVRIKQVPVQLVHRGEAGAIRAHIGGMPKQQPSIEKPTVEIGEMGVWDFVLPTGAYPGLDSRFYRVYVAPVQMLPVEWSAEAPEADKTHPNLWFFGALPLAPVTSQDGFSISIERVALQVLIPPKKVPFVIARFGALEERGDEISLLVRQVLPELVTGVFAKLFQLHAATEIMAKRSEIEDYLFKGWVSNDKQSEGLEEIIEKTCHISLQRLVVGKFLPQKEIANLIQEQAQVNQQTKIAESQVKLQEKQLLVQEARKKTEHAAGQADAARRLPTVALLVGQLGAEGATRVLMTEQKQPGIPQVLVEAGGRGVDSVAATTGAITGAVQAETVKVVTEGPKVQPSSDTPPESASPTPPAPESTPQETERKEEEKE